MRRASTASVDRRKAEEPENHFLALGLAFVLISFIGAPQQIKSQGVQPQPLSTTITTPHDSHLYFAPFFTIVYFHLHLSARYEIVSTKDITLTDSGMDAFVIETKLMPLGLSHTLNFILLFVKAHFLSPHQTSHNF